MAKRTRSQRTGDAAQEFVRTVIDGHPSWLARAQDRDFGVDLEAELAVPVDQDQTLAGKLIKLQVKGSESWEIRSGQIAVPLDRSYLEYVSQFRLPVILVAADVTSREAWFVWLQEWLLENESRLSQVETTATVTVHIDARDKLSDGLNGRLGRIARGEENTAMVLAFRELAIAAVNTGTNVVFESVLDVLEKIDVPSRTWVVQKTVDALIGLGPNVGFWQSQQFVPYLLAIVDRVGNTLTQEQIVHLIARGESYSRAALYGLSRLYDRWPDHARSLDLPAVFRRIELEEVAWYCELRQRYPELASVGLWNALGSRKLRETRFGRLALPDNEDIASTILTSWPNRGDSVFLDHLEWVARAGPSAEDATNDSAERR
jgi:Domain of unknown function (DUF4365)